MRVYWEGTPGPEEIGVDENNNTVVKINPDFYRPAEVDLLLGDATKAKEVLGWKPRYTFDSMIEEMIDAAISD